jgi:hypothetical protein
MTSKSLIELVLGFSALLLLAATPIAPGAPRTAAIMSAESILVVPAPDRVGS